VLLLLSASLVVIAMIDVPYQLWDHNKKLKMTLQEIKDEHKESEGSPEVKGGNAGCKWIWRKTV